ncbi:hypothetical protein [Demequina globuliformis]|uniref:hypothetical protein n=1 Tax=Demequina globuliformis TaxID=676202 RepID=UPI000786815B|nr:hypothetical protein [Demequina globuliformis]
MTTSIRVRVATGAASIAVLALAGCSGSGDAEATDPNGSGNVAVEETTSAPAEETSAPAQESTEAEAGGALEAYVAREAAQVDTIVESSSGVYSDIWIDAEEPSTIVYTYQYAEAVDPDEATAYFEGVTDTLADLCESTVFPMMEAEGVESPEARYVYLNSDGSELWSETYTSN